MERILTTDQREKLLKRHRKERDGKTRDRIKAVLAYDEGYSYSEIARILLLDDETIRRHVEDYLNSRKLSPANGGSNSKLSKNQSQKLIAHLNEVTYLHVNDICSYVKQKFNVLYSVSGMTKWLNANNFCYKKPHAVPAKANKEQQQAFIEAYKKITSENSWERAYFLC
jgi:transposase